MTRQSAAAGAVTGAEGVSGVRVQRDAARPSESRPWDRARRTALDLDAIAAQRLAHILGWHLTDEQRRALHREMAKGAPVVHVRRKPFIKVRRNQFGAWWVTCASCRKAWGGALHNHTDAVRLADKHARTHRPEEDDQ